MAEAGLPEREEEFVHAEIAVVLDCSDLDRAAEFWAEVLDYRRGDPAPPYLSLLPRSGAGPELLLQQVPERKHGKNRLHLDLRTRDLDGEVARVRAAGATVLTAEPVVEHGWVWHVLADPDGNEFCVLQPPAAHWRSADAP